MYLIEAIALAIERYGYDIQPCGYFKTFRESCSCGMFWFNTPDESTHVIKNVKDVEQ